MDSKKDNISQIRKYLNGELNAAAMHKLEREALDDPFLMDALEGYENTAADQQNNLAKLSGRLKARIEPKKGRVIAWRTWSIAASVLIVLTIGGLWLRKGPIRQAKNERDVAAVLADKTKTEEPKIVSTDTTPAISKPAVAPALIVAQSKKKSTITKPDNKSVYQNELAQADNATPVNKSGYLANQPNPAYEDKRTDDTANTSSLNEAVVVGYTQNKKKIADTITLGSAVKLNNSPKYIGRSDSKLPGSVPGLNVVPSKNMKTQMELARITGIILSQNDKSPLIGAAIRIKGTNKSTVTDVNGGFALSAAAPGEKQTLDIAYMGYQNTQVSVKAGDSLKVELKPYDNSLSEIVVTRKKNSDEEPAVVAAHPDKGWSSLKKYLQANAVLSDGTTGTVSLTFTVNSDGTTTDFAIKKSLNPAADQKAIDLLKNGPNWVASSTGKPETVTVKVKFQKQK